MSNENEGDLDTQSSRPIPQSYYGTKTRALSIGLGLGRIVLAFGTIPLSVESVRQGNFAADRRYITFYWTEALLIMNGICGIFAGIWVSKCMAALHSRSTLVIGIVVPMIYITVSGFGCKYDGTGINPNPGTYYNNKGKEYTEYAGNDADPKYAYILLGIGMTQFLLSMAACFIHHKSWEAFGKGKRRNSSQPSPGESENRQEEQVPFTYIPESRTNIPHTSHHPSSVQSSTGAFIYRPESVPTPAPVGITPSAPLKPGTTYTTDQPPPSYDSVAGK